MKTTGVSFVKSLNQTSVISCELKNVLGQRVLKRLCFKTSDVPHTLISMPGPSIILTMQAATQCWVSSSGKDLASCEILKKKRKRPHWAGSRLSIHKGNGVKLPGHENDN